MKKSFLLLFAALATLAASAQTKVEIDGIWYNLVTKAKQAEVTFKGSSCDEYTDEYSGSIAIPDTVTYEGVNYSVTSIEDYAFYGCSSLTDITIPEGVTSIGNGAFYLCSSLKSINIPESVTSIGGYAFAYCPSLTDINIPKGVTSIGNGAFESCNHLTAITIPEGVISIEENTFAYCSSLKAITIPKNVTSIGHDAFRACSLLNVYSYAENVPSTESYAFQGTNTSNATLHVPASALNAYKSTAPWSSFGNIVALTDEEMSVEQSVIEEQHEIYDLQGHRVTHPTKGIYIVDGKKMVIK